MLTPYIQRSPRKLQLPRSFGNVFLGFRFRGSGWKSDLEPPLCGHHHMDTWIKVRKARTPR